MLFFFLFEKDVLGLHRRDDGADDFFPSESTAFSFFGKNCKANVRVADAFLLKSDNCSDMHVTDFTHSTPKSKENYEFGQPPTNQTAHLLPCFFEAKLWASAKSSSLL